MTRKRDKWGNEAEETASVTVRLGDDGDNTAEEEMVEVEEEEEEEEEKREEERSGEKVGK